MTVEFFEVLNVPHGADVCVIEAPESFPEDFDFTDVPGSSFDFVPVFVNDPALFAEEVAEGVRICKEDGLLCVITPQDKEEDFSLEFMNRECAPLGVTPAEQMDLDDEWTATVLDITK